ncbi:MAG TPA: hypothetical protein VKC90_12190 [Chitinophagaceae bacterium]|nr:hypothetical protein [Chitinophagaceae bacterium]
MKKLTIIFAFLLVAGFSYTANAQVVKKTTHAVKKGATAAGNKTAEMASKSKSMITDKVYKGKMGPAGQTIYIDDHSRYYWVDKKGHRQYVTEAELRPKVKD